MQIEDLNIEVFKRQTQNLSLSEAKDWLKEIYRAKHARGRSWDNIKVAKVERMESWIQKILKMKKILTSKEQIEYTEYIKRLNRGKS